MTDPADITDDQWDLIQMERNEAAAAHGLDDWTSVLDAVLALRPSHGDALAVERDENQRLRDRIAELEAQQPDWREAWEGNDPDRLPAIVYNKPTWGRWVKGLAAFVAEGE